MICSILPLGIEFLSILGPSLFESVLTMSMSRKRGFTKFSVFLKRVRLLNPPPEGPRIEKIQSREAILKKSSFQYGMKFSIENGSFIPGPSLTAEKQGPGLKFSIENENFKPRMKISSENENFVRGGMVFSCVRARMNFFDLRALWAGF